MGRSDGLYDYQYDNEGNVVRRDNKANNGYVLYTWDHRNRLTRLEEYNASGTFDFAVDYRYNVSDELVARDSETFVNESGQRAMVIDAADNVTHRYVYGAMGEVLFDQRLDSSTGDQTDLLMPVADHAGSTVAVLDDALTLLETIDYAPFGEIDELRENDGTGQYTAVPGAMPADFDTVFGYHGRAYDPDTGLGHHAARWYDPRAGRFLSEDPIAADVNTYRFAGNDPINYGDPSGLAQAGHPLGNLGGMPDLPDYITKLQIDPNSFSTLGQGLNVAPSGGLPQSRFTGNSSQRAELSAAATRYHQQMAELESQKASIRAELEAAQAVANGRGGLGAWWHGNEDRRQIQRIKDQLNGVYGQLSVARDNHRNALDAINGNGTFRAFTYEGSERVDVGAAFRSGLGTGKKAVVNSLASATTIGYYDGPYGVTQQDIYNGYAQSRMIAGLSSELLVGLATGGASRYGRLGKAALAYDTFGNGVGVAQGLADVYGQGGLTFGNSLQIVGGAVGLGGNVALGRQALGEIAADLSRVRVSFDTATLSSGPLPIGGVKIYLAPTNVVDKSYKLKIQGTAQKTGTDGHQFRTYREAILEAKKPNVQSVHLDHGYNRGLSLDPKTISSNRRPDVLSVYDNGVVRRVEVQSSSDVRSTLINRNTALDAQIRAQGYTPTAPVIIQPTRTP